MSSTTENRSSNTAPLFVSGEHERLKDEVLLAIHQLGLPTMMHLYTLFHGRISNTNALYKLLDEMCGDELLEYIDPSGIDEHGRKYSKARVWFETDRGRKRLLDVAEIPYKVRTKKRSPLWNFLKHDVYASEDLVWYEKSAERYNLFCTHEHVYKRNGEPVFPKVLIEHEIREEGEVLLQRRRVRPQSDGMPLINGWHILHETCLGNEQLEMTDISQQSIERKNYIYGKLFAEDYFRTYLGWENTIVVYTTTTREETIEGARARANAFPTHIPDDFRHALSPHFYVAARHDFLDHGHDLKTLDFVRGDGVMCPLPCFV